MYLFKMCAGVLEPRILSVERDGGVVYSWRVSSLCVTLTGHLTGHARDVPFIVHNPSLQHMRALYAVTVHTIHTVVNKQHTCKLNVTALTYYYLFCSF